MFGTLEQQQFVSNLKKSEDNKNKDKKRKKSFQEKREEEQKTNFLAYRLPKSLHFHILSDQSVFIENSINEVRNTAVFGGGNLCDDGGADPTIDLSSGTIDSSEVIICGRALPVELYMYNVKLEDNNVRIEWATATEINNEYINLFKTCKSTMVMIISFTLAASICS